MITLATETTPTVRDRNAFRLGVERPCAWRGCDRRATHSCNTVTTKGNWARFYCYNHTVTWLKKYKGFLHEMGCRWKFAGLTPRAKQRAKA